MTLIESGGVKVEDVATALTDRGWVSTSFGDDTGLWISVRSLCHSLGIYLNQGGVRRCLDDLAERGRARRHPSGADYWQVIT